MSLLKMLTEWNFVLATSVIASLTAQFIKVLINLFIFHRFIKERMWGAGGMPSAHSATVCAMAVSTGRYCGVNSTVFAITTIVAIIVMYDAMGVRYETGEQAKIINRMLDEWIDHSSESIPFLQDKKLKEMVGHTPIEVVTGVVLGVAIGFLMPMP